MFQRRDQLSLRSKVGQLIWPRMGWKRTAIYFWHRLQRIPGTPSSIAAGFAIGTAISMTPFYGMHIVTAGVVAWALRANIFASVLGSQLANPWTAPPLWFGAYYLGGWMMGMDVADHPPNFISVFQGLTQSVLNLDTEMFLARVWPIFWPMILGSIPMVIVTGVVSYFAILPVIKTVQLKRIERRHKGRTPHIELPPAGADV